LRLQLIVTVQFDGTQPTVAAAACEDWDAAEATKTDVLRIAQVDKPVHRSLDLRNLPCVMQMLREHGLAPEPVMLDGFVHLDADETPGLVQQQPVEQSLGSCPATNHRRTALRQRIYSAR
jgi:deoxyribonuclease V